MLLAPGYQGGESWHERLARRSLRHGISLRHVPAHHHHTDIDINTWIKKNKTMLKTIIVDIIVLALVALAVVKFLQRDEQEHEQKSSQE